MKLRSIGVVTAFGLALAGCGGGGGDVAAPSGNAVMNVYIGDAAGGGFAQAWCTIYHADISIDGKNWVPVFDNPAGTQTNLASLSSAVRFMGAMDVKPGAYRMARMTMGSTMTMVDMMGSSMSPSITMPNGAGSNGKYTFAVTMPVNAGPGQLASMAIDFDLARFHVSGASMQISVGPMDPAKFATEQRECQFTGAVSNLIAGTSFTMNMGMMRSVQVELNSQTVISDQATGKPTSLANGQHVLVEGEVDPPTGAITAASIQVVGQTGVGPANAGARGPVDSVDSNRQSFVMNPSWAYGFTPNSSGITVQTSSKTVFMGRMMMGGISFSDLAQGKTVMVSGAYDASNRTLNATRVTIL